MDSIGSNIRVSEDERLTGIWGWLTFALVLLALSAAAFLWAALWPLLVAPVTPRQLVKSCIYGVLFLYLAFVIAGFLKRKRRTRILALIYFGVMGTLGLLGLVVLSAHSASGVWDAAKAAPSPVLCIAMSGYFIISRRVKKTFVE